MSRPPGADAPAVVQLGWELRCRREQMPLTREQVAEALRYSVERVKQVENGTRNPAGAGYMSRWGEVYGLDEKLGELWQQVLDERREEPQPNPERTSNEPVGRDQDGLRRSPSFPPVSDDEVSEAITEARKLSSVMNAVAVTASTLAGLDRAVHELEVAWRHTRIPLPVLFRRARGLRNQAAMYLAGHATDRQRLQLFVLAGTLQAYLAEALLDLGYSTAAWCQTGAGLALAKAAADSELHVILYGQRSRIRYWQGNYDAAVAQAEAGASRVRPGSLAAVKLFDKLAIAASRVGDGNHARKALHASEAARDTAAGDESYLSPLGEEFCAMGAAASLVILGDLAAARVRAQHAINRYQMRQSSSVNLTFARIEFARAQPDPAAAAQLGTQAIEEYLQRPRRSQLVVVSARQLDAMLPDDVPEVEDFRERLHALESSTRQVIPSP